MLIQGFTSCEEKTKYKVHIGCYKLILLDSYCGVFEKEVQQVIDLIGLLLTPRQRQAPNT